MKNKSRRSFSRRISWSFLGMGGITLFLVLFTLYQIGLMTQLGLRSTRVYQPCQFHLAKVMSGLELSYTFSQEHVYQGTGSDQEYDKLWRQHIHPNIDSLKRFSPKLIVEDQALLQDIFTDIVVYDSLNQSIRSLLLSSNLKGLKQALGKTRTKVNTLTDNLYDHRKRDYKQFFYHVSLFKFSEGGAIILAILLGFLLYRGLKKKISRSVSDIQGTMTVFGQGNLPPKSVLREDELDLVRKEINQLSINLSKVKDFAQEVGKAQYNSEVQVFSNEGEIGHSLFEMRERLKSVAQEREIRHWHTEGLARFSELLNKHSESMEEMAKALLSQLTPYVEALQGGMYVRNGECVEEEKMLLISSYAQQGEQEDKSFEKKQGLIGQAWHLRKPLYFQKLPKDYAKVHSGLGRTTPSSLYIFPLMANDELFGMIELSSLQEFTKAHRDFLEQLSQIIASTILSIESNKNTKNLLGDAQLMTQQMKAQEEEMKQNMEELHATQEEMERQAREEKAFTEALDRGIAMMMVDKSFKILDLNDKFAHLAHSTVDELIGKNAEIFLSDKSESMDCKQLWEYLETHNCFERIDQRVDTQNNGIEVMIKYLGVFDSGQKMEKILCLVEEFKTV